MTDQALIKGIQQDNISCYEALIDKYTRYVVAVIRKVAGSRLTEEDIEELASDVFIKLWEKRKVLEIDDTKEKAYIGRIARNITLNLLKKKNLVDTILLEEDKLCIERDTPEGILLADEMKITVQEAIHTLGEPDQTLFIRRYFYLEKVIDIASYLGMNEQTVATKLYRGKAKLKKILEERGIV